ncbi:hypothetical protein EYF80_034819 [Liparis tanakae]|uniref:Uncharacterized protein n=1 Tax=Liparis tanakae TaxID=230148 RepID=A0A4Z2GNT9_9TELE|nr:hypothetical protein EYF80_034819 [Liparis tanakae]
MNERARDKTPPPPDEYQATAAEPVPQVQPPFQGMGGRDPGGCAGASAEKHSPADTAVSEKQRSVHLELARAQRD